MAVPILQSWLVTHRRLRVHRRLGYVTTLVLAPLLVVSGLHMVKLMIIRDQQVLSFKFAFLDLCALTLFVLFLVLSIMKARQHDRVAHARYMTGTVLFALEPALERVFVYFVPGVPGYAEALYLAIITMEVIVVVLLAADWQRHRVSLPYALALGFFVAMHVSMTPVASSPAFTSFARWYATR